MTSRRRAATALALLALLGSAGWACSKAEKRPAQVSRGATQPRSDVGAALPSEELPAIIGAPDPAVVAGVPGPSGDPGFVVAPLLVPTASPGQAATVVFQTRPGSSCQIEIRYPPSGAPRSDRLPAATADAGGRVAWRWQVAPDAPLGPARAFIVCSGGSRGDTEIRIA